MLDHHIQFVNQTMTICCSTSQSARFDHFIFKLYFQQFVLGPTMSNLAMHSKPSKPHMLADLIWRKSLPLLMEEILPVHSQSCLLSLFLF